MKPGGDRRNVVAALSHMAKGHLAGLRGVVVEETETSLVVRYPAAVGSFWRCELSMEAREPCAPAPGDPLAEFLAEET